MGRTLVSPSAGATIVDKVKLYEGGTGVDNAPQALTVFDAVPLSTLNQPNGVAGLDSNGLLSCNNLPINYLSTLGLQGPTTVVKNSEVSFTITNYDAFTTYNVSSTYGSVSIDGNLITYAAPAAPGTGNITIDGRTITFTVEDYHPLAATLTGIDTGGTGNTALLMLQGSTFAMNGGTDTHLNTDWQIATDAAFTNIVRNSSADATNKTSYQADTLNQNATYYSRVRYRASGGSVGPWSNTVVLTTQTSYVIDTELASFTSTNQAADDEFGGACAMAGDGTRVAIGARGEDVRGGTNMGAVYIFRREGNSWVFEQKLTNSDPVSLLYFGFSLAMDDTGTRVVIGCPYDKSHSSGTYDMAGYNYGSVHVYSRSGTTWTFEAELKVTTVPGPTQTFGQLLGSSVATDSICNRIVAGAPQAHPNDATTGGAVYVWQRSGTLWGFEQRIFASSPSDGEDFGRSVTIDRGGDRLAVGAPRYNTDAGRVQIYTRSGSLWSLEQNIVAPGIVGGFGSSVCFDGSANRLAIGAPYANYNTSTGADIATLGSYGNAYIYLRSGVTWAQEAKLRTQPIATGNYFGKTVLLNETGDALYSSSSVGHSGASDKVNGDVGIYTRSGVTWSFVRTTYPVNPGSDYVYDFGGSENGGAGHRPMAINRADNTLVVGAPESSIGATNNTGRAYIFVS